MKTHYHYLKNSFVPGIILLGSTNVTDTTEMKNIISGAFKIDNTTDRTNGTDTVETDNIWSIDTQFLN